MSDHPLGSAKISGKNRIRVLAGDKVMTPYDLAKGRITCCFKICRFK